MHFSPGKVRTVDDDRFDKAARLNKVECIAALCEYAGVPWDPSVLEDRPNYKVRTNELRAILTALWLEEAKPDIHPEAQALMEEHIEDWAPADVDGLYAQDD